MSACQTSSLPNLTDLHWFREAVLVWILQAEYIMSVLIIDPSGLTYAVVNEALKDTSVDVTLAKNLADAQDVWRTDDAISLVVVQNAVLQGAGTHALGDLHLNQPAADIFIFEGYPTLEAATQAVSVAKSNSGRAMERAGFTVIAEPLRSIDQLLRSIADSLERTRMRDSEARLLGELQRNQERFELAARGSMDGIWDWDLATDRVYYSPRWKAILGYNDDEIGVSLDEWISRVSPEEQSQLQAALDSLRSDSDDRHLELEFRMRHKDSSYRWVLCRGTCANGDDGAPTRAAGSLTDITARKKAEESLLHNAFHDSLTGLPNRALFIDRLTHLVARAARNQDLLAVLLLNIDGFSKINEGLGYGNGDLMLKQIASRLRDRLRSCDSVARLGGDEFAILPEEVDPQEVQRLIKRVNDVLMEPVHLGKTEIVVSASIGVATNEGDPIKPEELLRRADIAMIHAKRSGKNRHQMFSEQMLTEMQSRLELEAEIRRGLEQGEFRVHYQPIYDLMSRRIRGFEALVRWQHPDRGLLSPAHFLAAAEDSGLILPLSEFILTEACGQSKTWRSIGKHAECLFVTVNMARAQFQRGDLVDTIGQAMQEAGLAPGGLHLEITETAIMENTEQSMDVLKAIKQMGIAIAMDDFGTGYSSLAHLNNLPIDIVKIDRSFVRDIETNERNRLMVKTILMLADNLGKSVVAEGIESMEQEDFLRNLACTYGQGYLFSRPIDSGSADMLLAHDVAERRAGA